MNFDVYFPFTNKEGKMCPGIKPKSMEWNQIKVEILEKDYVKSLIQSYREGNADSKRLLPAICYTGKTKSTRRADAMVPTQLFIIDVDHIENPREAWEKIKQTLIDAYDATWFGRNCILSHITPSGKGLRMVMVNLGKPTLRENMDALNEMCDFSQYGQFDTAVKDFSRLSFVPMYEDVLYESTYLYLNLEPDFPVVLKNENIQVQQPAQAPDPHPQTDFLNEVEVFTDTEKAEFDSLEYRGTPLRTIIDKYVEVYGKPGKSEVHNYYNEMVKNFRNITSNNKRCLLYLLPRFGHTLEECESQIKSICRVNTLSRLPRDFYFFLKDNGFYKQELSPKNGALREFMLKDETNIQSECPYWPPVFRELISTAPKDFIEPAMNALLPILGTLTSYVEARYPYDDRIHTTSFFSVIYAPQGTGKGFVERWLDLLFEDLKLRDLIESERENIYMRTIQKKGANDKAPDIPHVSLRLIPPKNSEAEFLMKQKDNHGYHMFTYAAEMDSWAKGSRAAGGNKDDMIRIAWDNGEYGQQFRSANTFKGTVRLYWNVLITGTIAQVEKYFNNVENGLVSRCSFTAIENQEFVTPPKWKTITKKGMEVIKAFRKRCDSNTYETPCEVDPEWMLCLNEEEFDKEVDWRFRFKEKRLVDCSWIMPTIDAFHKEQMAKATLDIDHARDVFRRRVGVRGFRLALLCTCLWEKPNRYQLEKCKEFINWWMHRDLENILKLWGPKYNEIVDVTPNLVQRSVFDNLGETFDTNDIYCVCMKQGIKTPIRRIVFDWKKLGYIEKISKDNYKKVKK